MFVQGLGLGQDTFLIPDRVLHLRHLFLHLGELLQRLLDLQLLLSLSQLVVLNFLFGPPPFGHGLEEVEGRSVVGADGLARLEDLGQLWVQFDVLLALDLDRLVPRVDPLIDPLLELLAQPGVDYIDDVLPPKLPDLRLFVREAHLHERVVLDVLEEVVDIKVLVHRDLQVLHLVALDHLLHPSREVSQVP